MYLIVFCRITMLGATMSGKTSLVSAFVNNYCPSVYTPTDDPVLYYKTLSLAPKKQDREGGSDLSMVSLSVMDSEPLPVLVEIEDTYASDRKDGTDSYGLRRDLQSYFLRVFPTKVDKIRWDKLSRGEGPPGELLSPYETPSLNRYAPITCIRMSFIIVFDANDQASFKEAARVYTEMSGLFTKDTVDEKPVVFLVANKVDEEIKSRECEKICREANEFAKKNSIEMVEMSSFKLRKVKGLFYAVLRKVQERPPLWKRNWKGKSLGRASSAKAAVPSEGSSAADTPKPAEGVAQRAARAGQENCCLQ